MQRTWTLGSRTALSTLLGATLVMSSPVSVAGYEPYYGEIMLVPYTFCPRGWLEANGAELPINQYQALYSLIGTTYGGNGQTTFKLPDLRGRVPVGVGSGPGLTEVKLGDRAGQESVALTVAELPAHSHVATTTVELHASSAPGDSDQPAGRVLAQGSALGNRDRTERFETDAYNSGPPDVQMQAGAVTATTTVANAGQGAAFNVLDPYLGLRYCIAIDGWYPERP